MKPYLFLILLLSIFLTLSACILDGEIPIEYPIVYTPTKEITKEVYINSTLHHVDNNLDSIPESIFRTQYEKLTQVNDSTFIQLIVENKISSPDSIYYFFKPIYNNDSASMLWTKGFRSGFEKAHISLDECNCYIDYYEEKQLYGIAFNEPDHILDYGLKNNLFLRTYEYQHVVGKETQRRAGTFLEEEIKDKINTLGTTDTLIVYTTTIRFSK